MAKTADHVDPMDWKHFELIKMELKKSAGSKETFGLILEDKGPGLVMVKELRPGSVAANAGISVGDYVLMVNGHRAMHKADVTKQAPSNSIRLTLARSRKLALDPQPPSGERKKDAKYVICRLEHPPQAKIGMFIVVSDGRVCVEKTMPNSLAANCGMRANDRIVAVDNVAIKEREDLKKLLASSQGDIMDILMERNETVHKPKGGTKSGTKTKQPKSKGPMKLSRMVGESSVPVKLPSPGSSIYTPRPVEFESVRDPVVGVPSQGVPEAPDDIQAMIDAWRDRVANRIGDESCLKVAHVDPKAHFTLTADVSVRPLKKEENDSKKK